MALPKAKQDALEARLDAAPRPEGGKWITAARDDARARLTAMGLPGKRDEYWRYTDPTGFNAPAPAPAALFSGVPEALPFEAIERVRLVFVDGVFDAAQSDRPELAGVEITRLAEAAQVDIHWARDLYGVLETRGQTPVQRPFAALNTAFAQDGVLIRVTGKAARPVSLVYLHGDETSDAVLHHVIRLEPGAEMTLLENGPGAARLNKVLEVDVADGARFHHVRTMGRDHQRRAITHIFARLGTESVFKSFTMTSNGRMTRNEAVIELTGDDAITHAAERCESRQVYKKVLKNGATGVFQGKILVKSGAQKTDGYQISQSLLLDGDSNFLAKPELEIYADDVKCSHGSTSGAMDETALYYLRSRGVPKAEAEGLLVLAFLAEAIAEIEDEALAEEVRARVESWLARHKTA